MQVNMTAVDPKLVEFTTYFSLFIAALLSTFAAGTYIFKAWQAPGTPHSVEAAKIESTRLEHLLKSEIERVNGICHSESVRITSLLHDEVVRMGNLSDERSAINNHAILELKEDFNKAMITLRTSRIEHDRAQDETLRGMQTSVSVLSGTVGEVKGMLTVFLELAKNGSFSR